MHSRHLHGTFQTIVSKKVCMFGSHIGVLHEYILGPILIDAVCFINTASYSITLIGPASMQMSVCISVLPSKLIKSISYSIDRRMVLAVF